MKILKNQSKVIPLTCSSPLKDVVMDRLKVILKNKYNLELKSDQANSMFWDWYVNNPFVGNRNTKKNIEGKNWLDKQSGILNIYLNFIKK